jgi:hypothetical protein
MEIKRRKWEHVRHTLRKQKRVVARGMLDILKVVKEEERLGELDESNEEGGSKTQQTIE